MLRLLATALSLAAAGGLAGCGGPAPPRLLLLLTVDTLRADHLGAYGSELGLTPNLDALARESLVFTAAYAASAFTLPSMGALLTGHYPESLGLWSNESLVPDTAPTLAEELRRRGWRTGAVVSNFVLRRSSGLDRGFDLFDDEFPDWETTRGVPERTASDTTDAALATLGACAEAASRCFLWVHYQDPHGPYTPPAGWRKRQLPAERERAGGRRLLSVRRDTSSWKVDGRSPTTARATPARWRTSTSRSGGCWPGSPSAACARRAPSPLPRITARPSARATTGSPTASSCTSRWFACR